MHETLPADEYARLPDKLSGDVAAASAEADGLNANAAAVRSSAADLDTESDVLHRLDALRGAVLERKRTAEQAADIDALRCAMRHVFPRVYACGESTRDDVTLAIDAMAALNEPTAIPLSKRDTTCSSSGVPLYPAADALTARPPRRPRR